MAAVTVTIAIWSAWPLLCQEYLIFCLSSPSIEVREKAVRALAEYPTERATKALLSLYGRQFSDHGGTTDIFIASLRRIATPQVLRQVQKEDTFNLPSKVLARWILTYPHKDPY
jgi:hypothetical protein